MNYRNSKKTTTTDHSFKNSCGGRGGGAKLNSAVILFSENFNSD